VTRLRVRVITAAAATAAVAAGAATARTIIEIEAGVQRLSSSPQIVFYAKFDEKMAPE
jgi:hypothetical protein